MKCTIHFALVLERKLFSLFYLVRIVTLRVILCNFILSHN